MAILILVFITLAGLQLQCAALRTEAVTGNLSLIASMLSTGWRKLSVSSEAEDLFDLRLSKLLF